MQYTEIFKVLKSEKFQQKIFDIFFFYFRQNIDCGYIVEPPQLGGSNEYPQSIFWSKNKKNRYTRFRGVYITWTCFPDGKVPKNKKIMMNNITVSYRIRVQYLLLEFQ